MVYLFCILILILSFFSSLFLYVRGINFATNKLKMASGENISFAIPVIICTLLFFMIFHFCLTAEDSLFDLSYFSLSIVILAALMIGICSLNLKTEKFSPLILAASCCVCSYIFPTETVFFNTEFNTFMQKSFIAVIWFVVAFGHLIFRKVDGLLSIHTLMLSFCMFVFYIMFGISSTALLFTATIAGIAAGYGVLNYHPAKLIMNNASILSFGFLVGFIILCSCAEGMVMPTMIVLSYFIISLFAFLLDKFIFGKNTREIAPQRQCLLCSRVVFLSLFIAIMQMFVENTLALFVFALLFSMWATGRMGIEYTNQSFMEINKEVFANLKKGFNELRDFWGKKK